MVRLVPADREFFPMLDQLAVRVTSAASLLTDLFESPGEHDPLVRLIREDEHAADELTRAIILRLSTSFVPPLDASEIYDLAHALDATIDILEDAATRVEMFHMTELDAPTHQLGAIVRRCALVIEAAVAKLDDPNSILDEISDAWRLEEEADAVYDTAMRALFAEHTGDTLDLLKRKELYDVLEKAINLSRDVAEVLTSIAVKRT